MEADSSSNKPSTVQRVIELIIDRIREGRYSPGQQVIVRDLCTELKLSKAPVREALHVLVGDGVIELLPNRSARIRELSAKSILDFVSVWSVLGGLNARLATQALRGTRDKNRIRRKLQDVLKASEQRLSYKYFLAIAGVHKELAEIANNSYIVAFIQRFHFEHYHRHIARFMPGPSWEEHTAGFRAFCEAILEGEGGKAELLFRKHLESVEAFLRQELPSDRDQRSAA